MIDRISGDDSSATVGLDAGDEVVVLIVKQAALLEQCGLRIQAPLGQVELEFPVWIGTKLEQYSV